LTVASKGSDTFQLAASRKAKNPKGGGGNGADAAREGSESDIGIRWRIEGTDGLARGSIGWPSYPARTPSTLDFTTKQQPGYWLSPRWKEVWFPGIASRWNS
jgi:hypothetical protein